MTSLQLNQEQGRRRFFQGCVERMLLYWRDHQALENVDIAVLDRERQRILRNIALGLELPPLWPLVKPLVIAFAPYMERRGHWDAWHSVLEQAIRIAQRAGDIESETTLTAFLARVCQRMGRYADVVRYYRRVIRLAKVTGNRFEEARACSNLGYYYIDGGRWWRAEVLSCHALAIFEELESDHGRAHTHNHLGVLYTRQKNWRGAEQHLQAACSIWDIMHDQHGLMRAHGNLGLLFNAMNQPLTSITHSKLALNHAPSSGEETISGTFLINIAVSYLKQENAEQAYQYAKRAEKIFLKYSDQLELANTWHQLGLIHRSSDQIAEANHYKTQALNIYRQFNLQAEEEQLRLDFS